MDGSTYTVPGAGWNITTVLSKLHIGFCVCDQVAVICVEEVTNKPQYNFGLGSEAAYVKKFFRAPVSDVDSLIVAIVSESITEHDGEENRKQCLCK